jgi:phosphoesterase RecJ-like protein
LSLNKQAVEHLAELVTAAKTILILQPEKPDTDSLTSALALEHILGDLGKQIMIYSKDELPSYISYFDGADRVQNEFPDAFDMSILVDTGGPQQVTRTLEHYSRPLSKKPFVVIDHHPNRTSLPIDSHEVIDAEATSTCEMVLGIAKELSWKVNAEAANLLVPGMLADTLNLSINTVGATQFRTMAELIDLGADVYQSHQNYKKTLSISSDLLKLKGRLLSRMELPADGKIALIVVTPDELAKYAKLHDPSDLVIYDMMNAKGVQVAVVIRHYGGENNKIKISTRAKIPVAAKACGEFGGGGHDRAAGAQVNDKPVAEVTQKFVTVLEGHIRAYEALQHPNEAERDTPAA